MVFLEAKPIRLRFHRMNYVSNRKKMMTSELKKQTHGHEGLRVQESPY